MNVAFEAELGLPADPVFLSLLRSFVSETCACGLGEAQRTAFVEACELGFRTIVGETLVAQRDPIRAVARCKPSVFELSLVERGLPIDDAHARRDPRWNDILARVDEAHWVTHAGGSELRLHVHRDDVVHAETPEAEAPQTVPQAPAQEYTIRRFVPADGIGVARCFYEAWGRHYIIKAMYAPERLAALNSSGELASFVAVDRDGEVAGHYALHRYPGVPIAEGGCAAVRTAHRGRELAERMRIAAEHAAPGLELELLYFEPVTDHVFTQKLNEKLGAHVCAISLGISPASLTQPGMEISVTHQRQSLMLYAKSLAEPQRRTVFVPLRHQAMVARIYAGLGIPISFGDAGPDDSAGGTLHAGANAGKRVGTIAIERIGAQTIAAALQALEDMRVAQHLAAIYVRVPLADPAAPRLTEALEDAGCFFSGVEPGILESGDALRLQYVSKPLDLSQLSILSPFGRELLDYVASAMPTIIR
jgi:hypothetical protein